MDRLITDFRTDTDILPRFAVGEGVDRRKFSRQPAFQLGEKCPLFIVGAGNVTPTAGFLSEAFASEGQQVILIRRFQKYDIQHASMEKLFAELPDKWLGQVSEEIDAADQGAGKAIASGYFVTVDSVFRIFCIVESENL